MSLSNAMENAAALLFFNNTNIADVGDATGLRGSSTAGSWYVALHTADPGEAGTQSTSEISYTGYARVAVARSGAGFTVTGNSVSPAANIVFGKMTAGAGGTATHWSIGVAVSGATVMFGSGTLTPNIAIANGNIPIIETTSTITFD